MSFPTLDESLAKISEIADCGVIDPDSPLEQLEIDSLDLLEWLYEIEESTGIAIDESLFSDLKPSVTLRATYEQIREYIENEAAALAG